MIRSFGQMTLLFVMRSREWVEIAEIPKFAVELNRPHES
jgi:hypothetical protein